MTARIKQSIRRLTALALCIVMIAPGISMAGAAESMLVYMGQVIPYMEPVKPDFEQQDFEGRLHDLLLRMNEFETFTAEEQAMVQAHFGINEAALSPEELAEKIRALEEYLSQDPIVREINRIAAFVSDRPLYSTLNEADRQVVMDLLGIEGSYTASTLFHMMEQDGFSLADSMALISIMATGLFDYEEAQQIIRVMPNAIERQLALNEFQQFARLFNIAGTVNARRLLAEPFQAVNEFQLFEAQLETQLEMQPEREALSITPSRESLFIAFTNEMAFEEAKHMFLSLYSVADIRTAFALGAAMQVEPQSIIAQGIGLYTSEVHSYEDTARLISRGLSILNAGNQGIVPPPPGGGPLHQTITANPFDISFNANESVNLNSGTSMFRVNILSLPGRNGFGITLDLVYNSGNADLGEHQYHVNMWEDADGGYGFYVSSNGVRVINPYTPGQLGVGWMFDLPYVRDGSYLYIPGRGSISLRQDANWYDTDLQFTRHTTFTDSHSQRSAWRLTFLNGTRYYFNARGQIIAMIDRFSNTIRFIYDGSLLSRIIDTNGREIRFTRQSSGNNRTITVISPDNTATNPVVFTINMTRFSRVCGTNGVVHHTRVDSVQNQVGAVTSFTYQLFDRWFIGGDVFPSLLLTQVNYPSGAILRFEYRRYSIPFWHGYQLDVWRVSARTFFENSLPNARQYQRTTFATTGDFASGGCCCWRSNYTVTVIQNNGLHTVHSFRDHLPVRQQTFNISNTLLTDQQTTWTWHRLPQTIALTEHFGGRTRTTHQRFEYNHVRQVTRSLSPLALGVTNQARYWTDQTYDSRFGLPLITTTRPNATTTVQIRNTLSTDGRRITRTDVYENNIRRSRTDFLHDSFGNITEIREFPNATGTAFITTRITYNNGTMPSSIETLNVTDAYGRSATVSRSFTYDLMWRLLTETDPNGYVTRWQYDRLGRVTQITFPNGGVATYAYDDQANTVTHATVLGATYVYSYTGFGALRQVTANGVVILTNIFDTRMRIIDTRNAQGIASAQRTTFAYDIFDRVTIMRRLNPAGTVLYEETTVFGDIVDAAGNRLITTTIHGTVATGVAPSIVSFVRYDRFGRLTQEGVTGGRVVEYTHDLAGRVITETSLGVSNTFAYNVFGVTSVRNILGHTATNTYDAMGRLVAASDFMGNVTHFNYDELGRLIRKFVPFEMIGNTIHHSITTYTYDRNGNLTRVATLVNVPGQTHSWVDTVNTFRHNRLISTLTGGAAGVRTAYTYDLAGNVLTKRVGGNANNVGGAITTFVYNNRGQLTRITDALGQSETFVYDANGLVIRRTDRNGHVFLLTYDNMGRLTREEVQLGNIPGHRAYTYTATGAIRTISNGSHTITNTFDAQGRLIQQSETGGIVKTYTYNAANNRTSFVLTVNGVRQINTTYTYDAAQRLHAVWENGAFQASYYYDANGRMISHHYVRTGADAVSNNTYRNLAGLVTRTTNFRRYSMVWLSSFTYAYYLDGNVRQRVESIGTANRTTIFAYDSARRLIREHDFVGAGNAGGEIERVYTFDARGNRATMTVTRSQVYTVTYQYDLNNRLTREARTGSNPLTTYFSYDRNGNLTSHRPSTTLTLTQTKTYNVFNQLTRVVYNGVTTDYVYGANGLRLSKTVAGVRTTHIWDGMHIVLELNAQNQLINRFIRCNRGRLIRSHHHGWYLFNARGDVIQRVNDSGAVLRTYRYTAFGIELNALTWAQNSNPFRFGAMYWDHETGNYYTPNRFFTPRTGRWTQPDPFFWGPGNIFGSPMQAANLFLFVMHNPIRFLDPLGLNAIVAGNSGYLGITGHISAFVQDEYDVWWYFYWGPDAVIFQYVDDPSVMETTAGINQWINAMGFNTIPGSSAYHSFVFIPGDFTASVTYFRERAGTFGDHLLAGGGRGSKRQPGQVTPGVGVYNNLYHLFALNCVHVTMSGIHLGILNDGTSVYRFLGGGGRSVAYLDPLGRLMGLQVMFGNTSHTHAGALNQVNSRITSLESAIARRNPFSAIIRSNNQRELARMQEIRSLF